MPTKDDENEHKLKPNAAAANLQFGPFYASNSDTRPQYLCISISISISVPVRIRISLSVCVLLIASNKQFGAVLTKRQRQHCHSDCQTPLDRTARIPMIKVLLGVIIAVVIVIVLSLSLSLASCVVCCVCLLCAVCSVCVCVLCAHLNLYELPPVNLKINTLCSQPRQRLHKTNIVSCALTSRSTRPRPSPADDHHHHRDRVVAVPGSVSVAVSLCPSVSVSVSVSVCVAVYVSVCIAGGSSVYLLAQFGLLGRKNSFY